MIRLAILDLYEGQPNQGMRCIRQIIRDVSAQLHIPISFDEFDVRLKNEVPDLTYDIYISTGGPGDPLASEGSDWEKKYFHWLESVENYNAGTEHTEKKQVFFICHSFQMACRYFHLGEISRRKSTAFGVFPVHVTHDGQQDFVFDGLADPFYVVDSRHYQVTVADVDKFLLTGAKVLCIEKYRPHVPLPQAVMGIRFNEHMAGTQFHPEADAEGMAMYLQQEEKKETVIENHGFEKWKSMVEQLNDPDKIMWTYSHVLPNFLKEAISHHKSELIVNS